MSDGIIVFLVMFLVLCAFGFITGAMALKRRRDGAVWFLIGYVSGPVAMIALALFPLPPK